MKIRQKFILFLIILIAILLRFYNLAFVPPSPSLDEVSIGYNVYSIVKTGADEYGTKFPLLLRAYDDWRPALYAYLVIPFVKIFNLTTLAVRLPSVILSALTVFATYLLVKELFKKDNIALLSSFLLAISPWHIYISRLGHEANIGLAFFIFAVLFFLRRNINTAIFFFVLSFISYQAEKVFIPVILLGIAILFRKELLVFKKKIFVSLLFSLLILTPFIKETFSPNALIRFQGTNIVSSYKERFAQQAISRARAIENGDLMGRMLYDRRILASQIFLEGYVSCFNPRWLFTNFLGDRHKVPGLGLLYFWEAPLVVLGIMVLIRKKGDLRIKKLIFLWFLAAPLASALTTDAPHAMRSYTFLPIWQIFSALGLFWIFNQLKTKFKQGVGFLVFGFIIIVSLSFFYKQYFLVFPKEQSSSFQYSLSKAIPFVLEREKSYNKVIFSNQDSLFQSYMFFLFFSRYDPILYQKQGGTKSGGFAQIHKFGKYEFRPIGDSVLEPNTLYIGNVSDFQTSVKTIKVISNLKGQEEIKIVSK